MPDIPFSLDSKEDWLYLFLGAFLAVSGVWAFGGFHFINDQISSYQASRLTPYFGEDLYFSQTQIDRLQEDFNSYEIGYCGRLDGQSISSLHVALIKNSSEDKITYGCKDYEILDLHTHPSGLAFHSDIDKESLKVQSQDGNTHISCVYGGNQVISCISYRDGNFLNHKVHIGS
ncbi:MAG: hypothetical protein KKD18_00390 [Nanoarchaeota archaeon]|nr:hypothetical protein [Nanoarchaeota archaeon]